MLIEEEEEEEVANKETRLPPWRFHITIT